MIVDCAVYSEGRRRELPKRVDRLREEAERAGGFAWVGLFEPTAAEFEAVRREFDLHELAVEIERVEERVFSSGGANPVERIYKLRREALEFARAVAPLHPALVALATPGQPHVAPELAPYFRDVADHAARVVEQAEGFGSLLAGVLQANLTQVSVRQNEDMRRISAWVAILAVPTMVAGIYGMNFRTMPELEWRYGYPAVLLVIAVVCLTLFRRFRKAGWL